MMPAHSTPNTDPAAHSHSVIFLSKIHSTKPKNIGNKAMRYKRCIVTVVLLLCSMQLLVFYLIREICILYACVLESQQPKSNDKARKHMQLHNDVGLVVSE